MNISEKDEELYEDGWRLQLNRLDHNEWRAFYGNMAKLPVSAKGETMAEAIERAQKKIQEECDD